MDNKKETVVWESATSKRPDPVHDSNVATVEFACEQITTSLEVIKKRYASTPYSNNTDFIRDHIRVVRNALARIESEVDRFTS